mmetsp:Transcript_1960/g.7072  ORF Transcript_1960/g.7072 Transcript_1960/m.7072 type:complete len:141 (+) Transcript_1960:57-479(+)|eukprot:CAMPEP_0114610432 /NCGR_PEP_ID=MMETSP0168-20121206/3598_1 /TAXON_ID=95228 ORGANISM="Vannella sp., Strain DIVA3 517/6/12" /NCGR_SAMPLE_ID=MMETSP0168 /ASSEMBLY_ACC=CAM_ASM_000044 /LENGTH=140 /DNA_ID=CAMNT_0001821375 /DNA_START=22 /DNA_END=444 /DNA_ORIENTATION=+
MIKALLFVCLVLASCVFAQDLQHCSTDADCDNGNPCSVGECNRNGFCEQFAALNVVPGISEFCCITGDECPESFCQTASCSATSFQCQYTTIQGCVEEYGQTSGYGTTLSTRDAFSTSSSASSNSVALAGFLVAVAFVLF